MTRVRVVLAALAVAALALGAVAAPTAAGASARRCGTQSVRVTHTNYSTTLHVYSGLCGRVYQAWATFFPSGKSLRGRWVGQGGTSTVYYSGGGNRLGGWNRKVTATGYVTRHRSYG